MQEVEQRRSSCRIELLARQLHNRLAVARPLEFIFLQSFVEQAKTGFVPEEDFDFGAVTVAKYKD